MYQTVNTENPSLDECIPGLHKNNMDDKIRL